MRMNLEASGMIEFFELLPQVCSGGVYLLDTKSLKFLFANHFFQSEIFAHSQEKEFTLDSLSALVYPGDVERWEKEINKIESLQLNEKREFVTRFSIPGLTYIKWIQFQERLVKIPSLSDFPLIIGFANDVTDKMVSEENVKEQIQLFLRLFENASVGMALQDWEGGYFRINDRFAEITGYSIEDLTNLNIKRANGIALTKEELEYFNILGDGLEIGEATLTRKDGRKINIYRRTNTFRSSSGKLDFFFVLLDDLTEKKQIEAYLLHSQKMETIGNLASNLAHDLNNYLQPIHVFSGLGMEELEQTNETKVDHSKIKEYLQKIMMAAQSARSMIHRIIRFSKGVESDSITVVDISAIIQSSIPILISDVPKGVDLEFSFSETSLYAKVDPVRVSKILGEIVSGSIFPWVKGEESKGRIVTILIHNEDIQEDRILVQISLSGIEAPLVTSCHETNRSIFEEDESRWSGIQIIARYIRNWGGELRVENLGDHGIILSIFLPVSEKIIESDWNASRQKKLGEGATWEFLQSKQVWIIEDDVPSLESLSMVLALKQIRANLFTSSLDAVEELRTNVPDFVISDYRMKDMNGLNLLRKIKNHNQNLGAILLTGNADGLDADNLVSEGILVRSKPISVEELYESILLSFGFL